MDAPHVLLSYNMQKTAKGFIPLSYKIIDVCNLLLKLKQEWNASNKVLYDKDAYEVIYEEGKFDAAP